MNETDQATLAEPKTSKAIIFSRSNKNKVAVGITTVALLALGSIFAINFPLETMIVTLFIGSVFVLDRR
jgi:glycine cleavage system H lipoate-binding protein